MSGDKRNYKKDKVHNKKLAPRSKAFRELQQEWYAKLREGPEPFKDIEYVSPHTGHEEVGYFRVTDGARDMMRVLGSHNSDQRLKFWRAMSNYLQHCPEWYTLLNIDKKWLQRRYQFIANRFIEGDSYREIAKAWKRLHPKRKQFSYFIVFQIVQEYIKLALEWNEKHEEGLLYNEAFEEHSRGES